MTATAKIFMSGNSQAVRLPKEFRFDVKEVEIYASDGVVFLRKPTRTLGDLQAAMNRQAESVTDFPQRVLQVAPAPRDFDFGSSVKARYVKSKRSASPI